jgi:hypothetical protein
MNVYDQIEKIFDNNPTKPAWAEELLCEIKELKILIADLKLSQNNTKSIDQNLMSFVNQLRENKKPNVDKNIFPKIEYLGYNLGIDLRGYLYDMDTGQFFNRDEAFKIYKDMYYLQNSKRFNFL